jgi:anti-sigma-K factor RskA
MTHQAIQDLLGAYGLDALDPEERQAVERHLVRRGGCAECQQVAHEYQSVAGLLALSLPQVAPNPVVKERLLKRIEPLRGNPKHVRRGGRNLKRFGFRIWDFGFPSKRGWGWAAALAVSIALVVVVRQNLELKKTVEEQAAQLAQVQGHLADLRSVFSTLRSSELHLTALVGLEKAPAASARMLWNPRERVGYFSAYDLPTLPMDRIYQLWVIADGRPIGAGIFSVDDQGYGEVRANPVAHVEAVQMFAVTIEPAGGRVIPTLDQMVLRGGY